MFVLVEERLDGFSDDDQLNPFELSTFGYLHLTRRASPLDPTDADNSGAPDVYEGSRAPDALPDATSADISPQCDPALVEELLGERSIAAVSNSELARLVTWLIDGVNTLATYEALTPEGDEQVHYFCEDTGLIDGGPDNTTPYGLTAQVPNDDSCATARNGACEDGGFRSTAMSCPLGADLEDCGPRTDDDLDPKVACPPGSNVTFFTVDAAQLTQPQIAALPCQTAAEGCRDQLDRWIGAPEPLIQDAPTWRCADDRVHCDGDRSDLRDGKVFYAASTPSAHLPLRPLVADAFRYEERFRRPDRGAFSPSLCGDGDAPTPYCYDPAQIEALWARVDCLLAIHASERLADASNDVLADAQRALTEELRASFGGTTEGERIRDGFERQLAELLNVLGDEALVQSLTARWTPDAPEAVFEGDRFEANGEPTSGLGGYELNRLHRALQTYQLVLDRFARLGPWIMRADVETFGFDAAVGYLPRVMHASTQKARVHEALAQRYLDMDRRDLARQVTRRGLTAAYLEALLINQLTEEIAGSIERSQRRRLQEIAASARQRYASPMNGLRVVAAALTDETRFGLSPHTIPFNAIDNPLPESQFERHNQRARSRIELAAQREADANPGWRDFDTDPAALQSELERLLDHHEDRLAELCGTFEGSDNRTHPATLRHAPLMPELLLYGDPCGLVGNGELHAATLGVSAMAAEVLALETHIEATLDAADDERDHVSELSREFITHTDLLYGECVEAAEGVQLHPNELDPLDPDRCARADLTSLLDELTGLQDQLARLRHLRERLTDADRLLSCDGDCPEPAVLRQELLSVLHTERAAWTLTEQVQAIEERLLALRRSKLTWVTLLPHDIVRAVSTGRGQALLLRVINAHLDALRLERRVRQQLNGAERLRLEALRHMSEVEQIDLLSRDPRAGDDPNVRILQSVEGLEAEIAFSTARGDVHRLARYLEYTFQSSLLETGELSLARTASINAPTLETLVTALENLFFDIEDARGFFGGRITSLSLKDDLLALPRLGEDGAPLTQAERTRMMRRAWLETSFDPLAYHTATFSFGPERVSPLTVIHLFNFVAIDLAGSNLGDDMSRFYMRSRGTGQINRFGGAEDTRAYDIDDRLAVVSATHNGQGAPDIEAEVYRSYRFYERPLINTRYELQFNPHDEQVNQDIHLGSLDDLLLVISYFDITTF